MSTLSRTTSQNTEHAHWSGVFAMTLCVFVLIASEFMPVSLLTPLARDLGVTEGLAGQGIAISGALAVLTSLFLSRLAGNINRKHLLLGMTLLMALSGMIIAFAPNYLVYMTGRVLIGIAIGGFWSMSAATAIRLVPPHKVARALAIFNGGNALATVVAAPLGSYLGATIGWRGAFLCLVPVAIVAFIWQCLSLPDMNARKNGTSRGSVFRLFRQPAVSVGLLACGLFFMGQFALFTYLRPFLETVTQVSGTGLSLILLTIGVAGFVGTLFVALVLNAAFYITLIAIPLLMAAIAVALILAGHNVWIVALLSGLWGMLATSAPTGWWTWIARTLPKDAEAGGGLMVAVIQLAIALGSTAGGIAFDRYSWQSSFALSGIVLLFAAALTFLLSRLHK
ncbi:MFS transporter [Enterobacter roggenkampii]|uniref:MFS transporter n=1 Tax=Enterobacter roggenkampii TaxID=1812935 RepID=UPI0015E7EE47|nr:MFS transporter [Enterobacter roggenkampii]MBA2152355.1 MFS transporter [Enterobacter roggenkampii]HEP0948602.1 MFS transporter [Enterobacter roggenkampii]HEP0952045.1 MFS transporter [Enterobacter roggenkampii]